MNCPIVMGAVRLGELGGAAVPASGCGPVDLKPTLGILVVVLVPPLVLVVVVIVVVVVVSLLVIICWAMAMWLYLC